MYVSTKGLSGYRRRRGMGDGSIVDGRYVMTTPITTVNVLPSGTNIFGDSAGNISFADPSSWIPGVPNWAVGAGAGMFALLMFAKAGR